MSLDELRDRLAERYGEPHRLYHDLRHLHDVLTAVDELADEAADAEAVRWAAWYHDAIYDVHATDNEERSAKLAEAELSAYRLPADVVREVVRLVRLTATHDPARDDRNGAVLCDADLAVLASEAEHYAAYAADVRAEHAHLDEAAFAIGRARVLDTLLAHEPLYRTTTGRRRWEERARANVGAELDRLRQGW